MRLNSLVISMSLEELDLSIQAQILTDIVKEHASLLDRPTRDNVSALVLVLLYGPCLDYVQCAAFDQDMGDEFRTRIALWTQLGSMRKHEAITRIIQVYDAKLIGWREELVPKEYQPVSPRKQSTSRTLRLPGEKRQEFSVGLLESLLGSFINTPESKAKSLKDMLIGSILQKVAKVGKTIKSKKRKDLSRTKSALLELRSSQRNLLRDLKAKLANRSNESNESLAQCMQESCLVMST